MTINHLNDIYFIKKIMEKYVNTLFYMKHYVKYRVVQWRKQVIYT
jgi:hypothetical protein